MKRSCCLLRLSQHFTPSRSPLIPDPAHLLALNILWANSAHQPAVLLLSDRVSLGPSLSPGKHEQHKYDSACHFSAYVWGLAETASVPRFFSSFFFVPAFAPTISVVNQLPLVCLINEIGFRNFWNWTKIRWWEDPIRMTLEWKRKLSIAFTIHSETLLEILKFLTSQKLECKCIDA